MEKQFLGENDLYSWTLAEARFDFERGLLKEIRIVTLEPGVWAVSITSRLSQGGTGWLLQSKRRDQRQFKSLKAAAEAVENIGFRINELLVK